MILGGLFLNRLFRLFGTSFVSQLGSGGSLPCVRRALSGEKKRHLPASSSLSYPYTVQTYSQLTADTLDSLTDILIYNMAEQPHTDTSGKSKKPSIISRITNKVSLFDRFSTSTQNPNSVAPGASTTQLRKVSSYPYEKSILAGGYKPIPPASSRRPQRPTANSQARYTDTQRTATLGSKPFEGDEKTSASPNDA
jgi:hypothetical protein